jgi:hypothetical protein
MNGEQLGVLEITENHAAPFSGMAEKARWFMSGGLLILA